MMSDGKSTMEIPRGNSAKHVALCSGGMDSAISTHVTMRWGPGDFVAYIDTGTGLNENREYIEDLCDEFGWQLWTLRTNESYEEKVHEHGFPGPSRHGIMYRSLKERQIQKMAAFSQKDVYFWTGVRSDESQRRMGNVEPVQQQADNRWTWIAPIHDWSKDDCRAYLDRFNIPRNDLWDTLGRSGDCFCGCFGSPEELLDLEVAGCVDHADWLRDLEDSVDQEDETGRWAWGALSEIEQRAIRADNDQQMTLCSTCAPSYPLKTDGGSRE